MKNYYLQIVPKDVAPDKEQAKTHAILRAKRRTRKVIIGSTWTAKRIGHTPKNHLFRVIRTQPEMS